MFVDQQNPQPQQSKSFVMLVVLLLGFISGAVGGGITGYVASASQQRASQSATTQTTGDASRTVVEESDTAKVVQDTKPSVVSIVISKEEDIQQQSANPFSGNPFFDGMFGQQQTPPAEDTNTGDTQTVEVCSGSGFVISADGLILTNRHVICADDAVYTVKFDDGTSYDATVLARDQLTDLAILKIDAQNLTPLTLGDSDSVVQGQTAIAIGNTLGEYSNTVTKGIISGLSRDIGGNYTGLIQTDAAINEGNSGGPLLNLEGEVIGINTAIDRSGEGIGFAIPVNEAKVAIDSTKEFGHIVRPALGVRYIPVDAQVAKINSLPFEYGAYIPVDTQNHDGIVAGGAAEKAGLKEGDIILEVDGIKVDEDHPLAKTIKSHVVGDVVVLHIYTDGAEKDVSVTLTELPAETSTTSQ